MGQWRQMIVLSERQPRPSGDCEFIVYTFGLRQRTAKAI